MGIGKERKGSEKRRRLSLSLIVQSECRVQSLVAFGRKKADKEVDSFVRHVYTLVRGTLIVIVLNFDNHTKSFIFLSFFLILFSLC